MVAPLTGRRLVVVGRSVVCEICADLLSQLGAELTVIDRVVGSDHGGRLEALDADGAIDGVGVFSAPMFPVVEVVADPWLSWAASGAPSLSSRPESSSGSVVAPALAALGALVQLFAAMRGVRIELDPFTLITERAAITGMTPQGATSAGGSARFERAADGWIAINLARPDDVAALPALLEANVDVEDWLAVQALLRTTTTGELVDRATVLGIPVGVPGEVVRNRPDSLWLFDGSAPQKRSLRRAAVPEPPVPHPLVVDFTSLWAGPLAGAILADCGARVIKVESRNRPDGARLGPRAFFDRLNGAKESLTVDFGHPDDRALLQRLLSAADVVLEASRPRALAQHGFDAARVAADGTCWISITGYGRESNRVAFGDDAAVAGGVLDAGEPPGFVGDALADPIAGLSAAVVGVAALVGTRGQIIDVSMAQTIAFCSGSASRDVDEGQDRPKPRRLPVRHGAAELGAHSESIRAEFGSAQ